MCLRNCIKLDGLDKKQVARLVAEYQIIADKATEPPIPNDHVEYDGHN